MNNDQGPRPEKKSGLPGGLFLLIFAAIIFIWMFQSTSDSKVANVSYSHQVESLVNQDLLVPDKSTKVALNDRLVTFHGQFRENYTEEGKRNNRFLTLLHEKHELDSERLEMSGQVDTLRSQVEDAAAYFAYLTGMSLPSGGFVIYPSHDQHEAVVLRQLSTYSGTTLPQVQGLYQKALADRDYMTLQPLGERLEALVREFRSPRLGISNEVIKNQLSEMGQRIALSLDPSSKLAADEQFGLYAGAITELEQISVKLKAGKEQVHLADLRSVKQYQEKIGQYNQVQNAYDQNLAKYEKSKVSVADVTWFMNNRELSTKALEKVDGEQYDLWYSGAEAEWVAFQTNKGLAFRVPDQKTNTVLERTFRTEEPAPNYLNYIFTILPIILIACLLYFVFARQMKGGGNSAMNFGKAPARRLNSSMAKVTFDDVAGIDEAKEELEEVVDFLKDPKKYTALGARIPKGLLLVGAPGTGKTLIARAVAGEAEVPFFSISGSDFVEMFVGVGASRVRDLFDQAKKSAPCIIFIDEIDAVGRHRGAGLGGGHDEREQTLNQLLIEMDGFEVNLGVILIAATNRPDVLDKALLRPGRFDRRVLVEIPDMTGRLKILKVHARKIKLADDVDLSRIAQATVGLAGAYLENILNEAALLAARKRRSCVTEQDLVDAKDKVMLGKERKSMVIEEEDKRSTAYHESGHAIVALALESLNPVVKVTIVPRGLSLGMTQFIPKPNQVSLWKKDCYIQLAILMGGRCAENIFIGDCSSGAQHDFKQATSLARSMVCDWGMSETVGPIALGDDSELGVVLGYQEKSYSDETAKIIDSEVKRLLDEAHVKATQIIEENRAKMEVMAEALLKCETLDEADINLIMEGNFNIDDKLKKMFREDRQGRRAPPPLPPNLHPGSGGELPQTT